MENLASVLTCLGQDDDALNIYLTLEGKFKRRKQTPQFLKYNMEIAYIKIRQGDLDEAYMRINEQTTLVGLFGQINHSMGTLLLKQGSYDDALKMFKTDLRQKNTIFGSNHTSTLNTKNSIAFLFKMQGKYEEALKISRNVYKERKKRLGKEHPDTLETHYNTALYLYKLGKYNSALKIAYSVDKDREKMIPGHPCLIQGKLLIVEILKDQGKYQEAMKMCDEVYEQSSKVLGEAHPKTLECYAQMANLKELILLEQNIDSS
ncbi:hypothetical protein HHI36_006776 [Cryptolaemus montrouzieri]|uniref:Kinesin light chain n=1 Tax=Cryptolaemus montrouzieri TaxID=559131 RepID=A0ABD2NYD8_9CUCU